MERLGKRMSDTTFDQARRCPVCSELGQPAGVRPMESRRQGKLHVFKCANQRCKKFDRDWIVQVRPDGTVPEPTKHREKSFPEDRGVARARIDRARASLDRLVQQSLDN